MGSIKNVVSEPIEGHDEYHMMVRDLGVRFLSSEETVPMFFPGLCLLDRLATERYWEKIERERNKNRENAIGWGFFNASMLTECMQSKPIRTLAKHATCAKRTKLARETYNQSQGRENVRHCIHQIDRKLIPSCLPC